MVYKAFLSFADSEITINSSLVNIYFYRVLPHAFRPRNYCVQVFLDGAIIPGWEGKIVAWVEEDRGEER